MGIEVTLGNRAAVEGEQHEDGTTSYSQIDTEPRVTTVRFPEDVSLAEAFRTITDPGRGVWDNHSSEAPEWVESSSEGLATLLAEHYGCEIGAPADLEDTYHTENGPPGVSGPPAADEAGAVSIGALIGLATLGLVPLFVAVSSWLRVATGRDFQSRVMGDTASTGTALYAAANYIGLTENGDAPADADVALVGELADPGLARSQATYAHTVGANTYTLTKTFTHGGPTARTIRKVGVFNAAAAGTMVFETPVPNPPTLQQNDQLTITETVTI